MEKGSEKLKYCAHGNIGGADVIAYINECFYSIDLI